MEETSKINDESLAEEASIVEETNSPQTTSTPVQQQYVAKSTPQNQIIQSKFEKFKEFLVECRRVLRATKKPSREEFQTIVKVSGLGIVIIGLIGFLIGVIKGLLFK